MPMWVPLLPQRGQRAVEVDGLPEAWVNADMKSPARQGDSPRTLCVGFLADVPQPPTPPRDQNSQQALGDREDVADPGFRCAAEA
jgi:hypothetical protein